MSFRDANIVRFSREGFIKKMGIVKPISSSQRPNLVPRVWVTFTLSHRLYIMNPSIRIRQNYITPLRSISRETEETRDRDDTLFTVRIPPIRGVRKFSNIYLEEINIEACL